jgi:hypothetical protein
VKSNKWYPIINIDISLNISILFINDDSNGFRAINNIIFTKLMIINNYNYIIGIVDIQITEIVNIILLIKNNYK